MADLLPCPFCGGKASIERKGDRRMSTVYSCDWCGCSLETGEEWDHGKAWNTRPTPVAPVSPDATGKCGELVTVAWQRKHPAAGWMDCGEEYIPHYRDHGQEVRELSPRSQAEELLAAERAKYRDAMEKLVDSQREKLVWQQQAIDLKADNAALTAEISAISGHLDCEADSDSILHTLREIEADKAIYKESAETLEAKLAAAEKAVERAEIGFDQIHQSLMSNGPKQASGEVTAFFLAETRAARGGKPS